MSSPSVAERVEAFLAAGPWAVAGASTDRAKFGNRVLRRLQAAGKLPLYPLNPRADEVEGLQAYPDLASCPESVRSLSLVTPPSISEAILATCTEYGVEHVWLQPGAESPEALALAESLGLSVLAGGPCVLVELAES